MSDDLIERMVRALKFTNLRSPESVRRVLDTAGFTEDEIRDHSEEAVRVEGLRRSVMLTRAITETDDV